MQYVFYWINDYLHMAWHGIAMYFYPHPPKRYLDHATEGKCPIIMLSGILSRWAFVKPLADSLSRDGYPVHVVPALGSNLLGIEASAEVVRLFIEERDIHDAVIVAHSKGGLIGKDILEFHNGDRRVAGMVSLATPYSGSAMAAIVPHHAFRELLPTSGIMLRLHANGNANRRIISVIPEFDNHVWSKTGSRLEGALDNITVPVHGHHVIAFDKKVWDVVKRSIERLRAID